MSVDALCNQVVTLRRFAGVAVNVGATHGEASPTYTELSTRMYIEATGPAGRAPGKEDRANRGTPTSEWFGIGLVEIDFATWDEVVYNGSVLEIVSPPKRIYNPRVRADSHWEMFLRQVDGDQ